MGTFTADEPQVKLIESGNLIFPGMDAANTTQHNISTQGPSPLYNGKVVSAVAQDSQDWHWRAHEGGGKATQSSGCGLWQCSFVPLPFPSLPPSPELKDAGKHLIGKFVFFSSLR